MKRRVLFIVNIIIFINIFVNISVFAGDVPESALLSADFCIIGEVEKYENSIATIKIKEVLFGEYSQDTVDIADLKFMEGRGNYSLPKEGDYCAVAVQKSEGKYIAFEGHLAAKADSLDKNTLKLNSSDEFIQRMNDYINNGWYSQRNLEDIRGKISGNANSATSSPKQDPTPSISENAAEDRNSNVGFVEEPSQTSKKPGINLWIIGGVVLAGILIVSAIGIKKNKGKTE